jgi:hypothetical protein
VLYIPALPAGRFSFLTFWFFWVKPKEHKENLLLKRQRK